MSRINTREECQAAESFHSGHDGERPEFEGSLLEQLEARGAIQQPTGKVPTRVPPIPGSGSREKSKAILSFPMRSAGCVDRVVLDAAPFRENPTASGTSQPSYVCEALTISILAVFVGAQSAS